MTAICSDFSTLDMMSRHRPQEHNAMLPSSSPYGEFMPIDPSQGGLPFITTDYPCWELLCWPNQTETGAQNFHAPGFPQGFSNGPHRFAKNGSASQAQRISSTQVQEMENEVHASTRSAQWGSQQNSPATSGAVASPLNSEVSYETLPSNFSVPSELSLSHCSPSMNVPFFISESNYTNGLFQESQPMYATDSMVSSPAFSVPMSRGNSAIDYHAQMSKYPSNGFMSMDMPLFGDEESTLQTENCGSSVISKGGRRRNQPDQNNAARSHHYYTNAQVEKDGLYHCPWEKTISNPCQHKPEKLKCNYDKNIDSHLKPYRCTLQNTTCPDAKFSSTACKLRHEREAHAMHTHGYKPFNCEVESCERAVPGNGFPRHWNLGDHMKRVHQIEPKPQDPEGPKKGSRKRKTSAAADKRVSKKNNARSPKNPHSPLVMYSQQEVELQEKKRLLQALVDSNDATAIHMALQATGFTTRT